ncbi:hypothetical protein L3X38_027535 [Prunus dulcis]|uniref:Uncharacterized protein n=1 Tax=Prunus dulcis TaxID=3755 RepID=A0AAD4VN54_PRUDU|nr:hypothetical protein L3X38_027535 [Prunus dulcis]
MIRNPGRSRGHRVGRAAILAGLGTPSLPSRNPGRCRDTKFAESQILAGLGTSSLPSGKSWQVSGHQVCRAANPGTHSPSVPGTREAKSSALT